MNNSTRLRTLPTPAPDFRPRCDRDAARADNRWLQDHAAGPLQRRARDRGQSAARADCGIPHRGRYLGGALPRYAQRSRCRDRVRSGAARNWSARASGRRPRADVVAESQTYRLARRLRARTRRQRYLQAGAGSAQPRTYAGSAGLADLVGTGCLCSTRWAATTKRSATTPPRCASSPTSPACCRISACPKRSRRISFGRNRRCAAPRRNRASIRGSGRISRWSSVFRAASRRPSRLRRPICRPTPRPPTSPTCARCLRSKTA